MSLSGGKAQQYPSSIDSNSHDDFKDRLTEKDRHKALKLDRRALRRKRNWTICGKLLVNIVFLLSWSCVQYSKHTYFWSAYLLGGGFWRDFGAYTAVSVGLALFSFIGLFRDRPIVCQVWFEILWLVAVVGFDGYLIYRQVAYWPPFGQYARLVNGDPYLTISHVLYVLTVAAVLLDLLISLIWSGFLLTACIKNRDKHPKIWFSQTQDFPWAPGSKYDRTTSSAGFGIIGTARNPPPVATIKNGVQTWFFSSTPFRRFSDLEPISYCFIRGVVASLLWIVLIVYGILNCVINPLKQFTDPGGLPTKMLAKDDRITKTYGHISGFIALDVLPREKYTSYSADAVQSIKTSIAAGIQVAYNDTTVNQQIPCLVGSNILPFFNTTGEYVQIEAIWDCPAIWDAPGYRKSPALPDQRPFVTVIWQSDSYPSTPVLSAGLLSLRITGEEPPPGETDIGIIKGDTDRPREWQPGLTFDLVDGQSARVNVGRRRMYNNRATFLDLLGVSHTVYPPPRPRIQVGPRSLIFPGSGPRSNFQAWTKSPTPGSQPRCHEFSFS